MGGGKIFLGQEHFCHLLVSGQVEKITISFLCLTTEHVGATKTCKYMYCNMTKILILETLKLFDKPLQSTVPYDRQHPLIQ